MARVNILTKEEAEAFGWSLFENATLYTARKTFNDGELYELSDISQRSVLYYITAVENGYLLQPDENMYFRKEELHQWISPQQLLEFEKMYPDCVIMSYLSAIGLIRSQIGEIYDVDAILSGDTSEGTRQVFAWILKVITAYNVTSPSSKRSGPVEANYIEARNKLVELKNYASTMSDGPIKPEPNAMPTIISNKYKTRG